MSSWAQQREAIRRAAQGGVRARTNAQARSGSLWRITASARSYSPAPTASSPGPGSSTTASWEAAPPRGSSTRSSPSSARGRRTTSSSARGSRRPCAHCSPTAATTSPSWASPSSGRSTRTGWRTSPCASPAPVSGAATPADPTSATTSCPSQWSTVPCPGSPAGSAISRPTPASRRPP